MKIEEDTENENSDKSESEIIRVENETRNNSEVMKKQKKIKLLNRK